jgi:hypothetical protein
MMDFSSCYHTFIFVLLIFTAAFSTDGGNMKSQDRISATTTYVMWSEEHIWTVCVFQRVHFSNLIFTFVT